MLIVSEHGESKDKEKYQQLHDERLVENLLDGMHFNELLDLAEQICLSEPVQYPEYIPPDNAEADVVAALGVRGVRYALELAEYRGHVEESLIEGPFRQPELFNGPLDREMLAKATAFGDALIRESYNVLGKSADQWAEEFANADNDYEQMDVLLSVHTRLQEIGTSRRGLVEKGDKDTYHYHPIRLSPKIVGTYPDFELAPTCLGIAAIGAGFFEKAGATYLHAGVMQTVLQSEQLNILKLIDDADEMCETLDTTMSEDIFNRLGKKGFELSEAIFRDTGTHSALMVRLVSGRWYQFDPNLDMSAPLYFGSGDTIDKHNKEISRVYNHLVDYSGIAPGLELSALLPTATSSMFWRDFIGFLGSIDNDAIEEAIVACDDSLVESIRRCVVDDYLLGRGDSSVVEAVRSAYLKNFTYAPKTIDEVPETMLNVVARKTIASFALWDMTEEEWIEKYESDSEFRERAIEDIKRLPVLIGVAFGLEAAKEQIFLEPIHHRMELGMPQTSIGLSVLHNIGLYMADDLSAHHWLSQWPSSVVPPDMIHKMHHSPGQEEVVQRNVELLLGRDQLPFVFSNTYGKMIKSHRDSTRKLADTNAEESESCISSTRINSRRSWNLSRTRSAVPLPRLSSGQTKWKLHSNAPSVTGRPPETSRR